MLRRYPLNGVLANPKFVNEGQIADKVDIFNFELSADEIAAIDALDTCKKVALTPISFGTWVFDF